MEQFLHYYQALMATHEARQWRQDYKAFFEVVQGVRNRLDEGAHLDPAIPEDYDFLKRLLFDNCNGIANRGRPPMNEEDLRFLLGQEDFMFSLEAFIRAPSACHFDSFKEAWDRLLLGRRGNRALLLANRTAAACTTDVSTTPQHDKFNQVFSWLNTHYPELGLDEYNGDYENWFSKNVFLMRKINAALDDARMDRTEAIYDAFSASIFPWTVVAHERII